MTLEIHNDGGCEQQEVNCAYHGECEDCSNEATKCDEHSSSSAICTQCDNDAKLCEACAEGEYSSECEYCSDPAKLCVDHAKSEYGVSEGCKEQWDSDCEGSPDVIHCAQCWTKWLEDHDAGLRAEIIAELTGEGTIKSSEPEVKDGGVEVEGVRFEF